MKYNVAVRVITFVSLIFFASLDGFSLWLTMFYFKAIAAENKPALAMVIIGLFPLQGLIFYGLFGIFGTHISFDDVGVYRQIFNRQEMLLPWSEISSFRIRGQIEIFSRGTRKILVSSYRNGRDDLISELRSRNIPSR